MLSVARIGGGRGRAIVATVLLVFIAAACGGAAMAPRPVGAPAAGGGDVTTPVEGGNGEQPAGGNGGGNQPALSLAGGPDLLIIKTGAIALQVTSLDSAVSAATQQITGLGGYASGSERFGDGDSAQASVTFRIPATRWDEALVALRGLASKIIQERTSTEDVTGQVVDLGARIRNLQATEKALQAIMERATEIKDVLSVQAELTKVRGEIEELTAQKTHLEEQAAFSTLTVTFALKPNPVLTSQEQFDPASEVDEASASLVGILQGLATAGIWFAIVWLPILLALGLLAVIGVAVFRRLSRPGGGGGGGGDEPMATPTADA